MSGPTRAPGWYPDPWGTPEERYFDGEAWARTTRGTGGSDAPAMPGVAAGSTAASRVAVPAPLGPTSAAPPAAPPVTEPTAPVVPAGWYADPWGASSLRYWDGAQWTGHVSGPAGAGVAAAPRLDEERTASRWAKVGLAWGGPALAISTIAGAFQWHWIGEHWDELTTPGSDVQQSGNTGAAIAAQLSFVVLLVVAVLFLLWFHRAAANAASAGFAARRGPGWATASFLIPILNLWWPYQSTCDLLPADHPARGVVRRWWALWIGCTIGGFAVMASGLAVNDVALGITTGVAVVFALLAAMAARTVVSEVADAHGQLLG